jgi:adenosylhomocysteinase
VGADVDWVLERCRLLASLRSTFADERPFAGLTVGTAIHLEPKTAALLLTLQAGGARVVATGNLSSTQPEVVDRLRAEGVDVVGSRTVAVEEHDRHIQAVLEARPNLILDNGGDCFVSWLADPYEALLGGTEETTSGRRRLAPLRDRIRRPLLVVNDSPIKRFAENFHAVGTSVLESYQRITNGMTQGRRVVVFGYGPCGQGVAAAFQRSESLVAVVEVDPVARLEALLDGFAVPERSEALGWAEVVVTVTGSRDVIGPADLELLTDGVVLANAGHLPFEIDVAGLLAHPSVQEVLRPTAGVTTLVTEDRRVHLLADGHMVNLAGPRPLGNSIESMDLGFALQARCLAAIALGKVPVDACVVPPPRAIDQAVASAYLAVATPS